MAEIAIEQVAGLAPGMALAITRSDPGDNLDLTRHTPLWALVELLPDDGTGAPGLQIWGGEGVGRLADGNPAIYRYARQLLEENLGAERREGEIIRVTLVLPEGRALAQRTSNEAFGVVDGLSLLGTSGISQPLSAPGQLEAYREELRQQASQFDTLAFCVGENGLDLALKFGIAAAQRVKTANWLGPLLVEAGVQGVQAILLFGHHGKLVKLAGGIFHTHHHVADGRQEVVATHAAIVGLPTAAVQALYASPTLEDGLQYLRTLDQQTGSTWVEQVYASLAVTIDRRSQAYIQTLGQRRVRVGCLLFDRHRQVIITSPTGQELLNQLVRQKE